MDWFLVYFALFLRISAVAAIAAVTVAAAIAMVASRGSDNVCVGGIGERQF